MANTRIIIYFFVIISAFIKCDIYDICDGINPSNENECFDRISEDDKEDGYHCCHISSIKTDGTTEKECEILIKDEYNDIDGYKNEWIKDNKLKDAKVVCHQSYIKLDKYKYLMITLLNLVLLIIM